MKGQTDVPQRAQEIIDHVVVNREGGYVFSDHRFDRGGQTFAGISRRWNERWPGWSILDLEKSLGGVTDDWSRDHEGLRRMTLEHYYDHYWSPLCLDDVENDLIKMSVFSMGILSGVATTAKIVQKILSGINDINVPGLHLEPVAVDGIAGAQTMDALGRVGRHEVGSVVFSHILTLAQISRFVDIVRKDRSQDRFLVGWINRVLADATDVPPEPKGRTLS